MSEPALVGERCFGGGDPLMAAYHDTEWGRPVREERALFEKVCLEGFQAGLSWRTVLVRRDALRAAFGDFEPAPLAALAASGEDAVDDLLSAEGMLRNRAKVRAVLSNARALLALHEARTTLADLVWAHRPVAGPAPRTLADVPATTPESTALAAALRRAGFSFVGPTTCYALMQADGLVNDHLARCPVRADVERAQGTVSRRVT